MEEQLKKLVGKRVVVSNLTFHIEGTLEHLDGSLFRVEAKSLDAKCFVNFYAHEVIRIDDNWYISL